MQKAVIVGRPYRDLSISLFLWAILLGAVAVAGFYPLIVGASAGGCLVLAVVMLWMASRQRVEVPGERT